MKVKIITCNRAYNLGAVLQTYALQEYLNFAGYDAAVIDYNPDYFRKNVAYTAVGSYADRNFVLRVLYMVYKIPRRFTDHRIFRGFLKKYVRLTDEYRAAEDLERANLKADVFICGSDQIWCPTKPTGRDDVMYLSFVRQGSKVSYAASFGETTLTAQQEAALKNRLSDFSYISVRESSGVKILQKAGIGCVQVMDPVFLLSEETWTRFSASGRFASSASEGYVLVYPMSVSDAAYIIEVARRIASERNLQVMVIAKGKMKSDRTVRRISDATPQDFVGLLRNASFIVTNSFHGTAFSIIFNREFVVCGKESRPNTRIDSLLELTGLSARYINVSAPTPPEGEKRSIDYSAVNRVVAVHTANSRRYLSKALNGVADKS